MSNDDAVREFFEDMGREIATIATRSPEYVAAHTRYDWLQRLTLAEMTEWLGAFQGEMTARQLPGTKQIGHALSIIEAHAQEATR